MAYVQTQVVTQQPYGYGPPPVVIQPQGNQVAPSIIQPALVNVNPGHRDWSTGIFGCLSDINSCMCVWFFYSCARCGIADRLGESVLLDCCVPGFLITLRTKLRLLTGIRGSVCEDCLCLTFCHACAMCQMIREMDKSGVPRGGCY